MAGLLGLASVLDLPQYVRENELTEQEEMPLHMRPSLTQCAADHLPGSEGRHPNPKKPELLVDIMVPGVLVRLLKQLTTAQREEARLFRAEAYLVSKDEPLDAGMFFQPPPPAPGSHREACSIRRATGHPTPASRPAPREVARPLYPPLVGYVYDRDVYDQDLANARWHLVPANNE